MENIIEYMRKEIVNDLLTSSKTIENSWPTWRNKILQLTSQKNPISFFDLGEKLHDIFTTTRVSGRDQSTLSGSGTAWESLVAWYLNLVSIGRRTIIIKHKKAFIPKAVEDAITVNYNNFQSNTESDLIAVTFPDEEEFAIDKNNIIVYNNYGQVIPVIKRDKYNLKEVIDALCEKYFKDLEIHIIQCKTNWNDNAQIPMLWDMIYSADQFKRSINVGRNGRSIHEIKAFSYSFVTVPTVAVTSFTPTSTPVLRVNYLGLCQIVLV